MNKDSSRSKASLEAMCRRLEQDVERYRTVIDAAPDPICLTRLSDGKFIEVNQAFYDRTGFSKEEIADRNAVDLGLYIDEAQRTDLIRRLKKEGQIKNEEMLLRTKDGTQITDLWSLQMIDYNQEPHLLVVSRNHDELLQAQAALKESEEGYRMLMESAPYSITVTRVSDARYMIVNESFCKRTGFSREEAVGKSPYDLGVAPDPALRKKLRDTLKKYGHAEGMEMQFRSKSGKVLENLVSATLIQYKGEPCILIVSVGIDDLKAAQQALKASEERYRNILRNMEEGYWEIDLTGVYTFVNEAHCRIHGLSKKDLIGRKIWELISDESINKFRKLTRIVYETGIPAPIYEIEMKSSSDVAYILESSMSLLKNVSGKPVGFFGVSRDVTEKREAQKELEQYREHLEYMVQERTQALEAAQKELIKKEKLSVLGQLTATVSHELRNPLGVIRSSGFYLQRKIKTDDEKILKHFKRIEDQINLCDGIVEDLLEYTRGEKVLLRIAPVQSWLNKLIRDLEESLSIPIQLDLPKDLPAVSHDREKLRRVFINLVENAVHSIKDRTEEETAAGIFYEPIIRVAGTADEEAGKLVFAVSDNGTGMEGNVLKRAVEPLFTTRARGTGIGLATVQKIVSDHEGNLKIQSTPGTGTTVLFSLKL